MTTSELLEALADMLREAKEPRLGPDATLALFEVKLRDAAQRERVRDDMDEEE